MANDEPFGLIVVGGTDYDDRENVASVLDSLWEEFGPFRLITGRQKQAAAEGGGFVGAEYLSCKHALLRKWAFEADDAGGADVHARNDHLLDTYKPEAAVVFYGGRLSGHLLSACFHAGLSIFDGGGLNMMARTMGLTALVVDKDTSIELGTGDYKEESMF